MLSVILLNAVSVAYQSHISVWPLAIYNALLTAGVSPRPVQTTMNVGPKYAHIIQQLHD